MEKRIELKNWHLMLAPNADVVTNDFEPTTVAELESAPYLKINATVPGCMELDLHKAGLAPDPYFGKNPLEYQQYENRHLWYYTTFDCDEIIADTQLLFEGIDTVASIFLNGGYIGYTDNMLIEHAFYTNGYLQKGKNELIVHIEPTMIAARNVSLTPLNRTQYYNQASLAYRKAAYMFGWDIMPRFVSGGLWKPVYLVQKSDERLEQCYLYTTKIDVEKKLANMTAFVEFKTDADLLCDLRITVDGVCGDSCFHKEKRPYHVFENIGIKLEDAKLWYPKNYGEQPLYDVTFRLWRGDTLLDEKSFRFGVRMIELERTSVLDKDGNGKFGFIVNGQRVFCLGTNWVPLDAFPCRHKERLPMALALLEESGCNMVRCWGGNVYEDDAFYDFCDEKGIMVWQDFGMGCAIYPEEENFLTDLEIEAIAVVKRLRHHAALALWAGDNEIDTFFQAWFKNKVDPNGNPATRRVLPSAVRNHDPMRPYIPSSPYVDSVAFESRAKTPEDHLWGPRDYFKGKYYKGAKSCFASEIGYHGCPSPESLKKFISEDQLYPMLDEKDQGTPEYLVHAAAMDTDPTSPYAYRIPLMVKQVRTLFGGEADNLTDFAKQSQISQAEAKKYFIEKFRMGKPHRTGLIWWNLLDGWPQVSDAVIDWYGCKKLAFQFIKRSQQQLCLMFDEPEGGKIRLFAVQDGGKKQTVTYTVRDVLHDTVLCSGTTVVMPESSAPVVSLKAHEDLRFLLI
ncbi:MAG: glycoside hydrolase family 2, partial [Clostridia bacterium]|nr:glycoside hydrolase family 2 [Clostridia bacterium]